MNPTRAARLLLALAALVAARADAQPLPAPPQDQGLPYTRSARAAALTALGDRVAVFAGSRYGIVRGMRARLDPAGLRSGEAELVGGRLLVPAPFLGVLDAARLAPDQAPAGLEERWIHDLGLVPSSGPPADLAAAAEGKGLESALHPRGLLLVGPGAAEALASWPPGLLDAVITLFDTPERFADPGIAARSIPNLARQGSWEERVRPDAATLASVSGKPTSWPRVALLEPAEAGHDPAILGGAVPPPGTWPRLLFSPEDLPALRARIAGSRAGRMSLVELRELLAASWLDPRTDDGRVFDRLASGDTAGLQLDFPAGKPPFALRHVFRGQRPSIRNTHVAYVPECLVNLALLALLEDDDALGRRAATALANYYGLLEPHVDALLATSDSEFGSSMTAPDGTTVDAEGSAASTHWRGMHALVAHMNLAFALDFGGRWMDEAQRAAMTRVIAKATYGRRSHGQDGPSRLRDVNWMAWDLTHFLAVAAIEGLPGHDPEAFEAGAESVRAFLDWGIDPDGVLFESNGKAGGSMPFLVHSLVVLARRGDNLFVHPHLARLAAAQAQCTSPSGRVIPNSGTVYVPYSRQELTRPFVSQLKAFYPRDLAPDLLMGWGVAREADDASRWPAPGGALDEPAHRAFVRANLRRIRLPGPGYPGMARNVLFDADVERVTRADAGLPLDFVAPVHGVLSTRSSQETDAAWLHLLVRPNHYLGAGHHHADAGMVHFSALGVDWVTESAHGQEYDGNVHNVVQVDGRSLPAAIPGAVHGYNAAATWLGASVAPSGAFASADLAASYTWRWMSQPPRVWTDEVASLPWEPEPSPAVRAAFAGTLRDKLRPWWPTYAYSGLFPTARAPYNPVRRATRTAGLVRAAAPFGVVVDDLAKDDEPRDYDWVVQVDGGVRATAMADVPPGTLVLAHRRGDPDPRAAALRQPVSTAPGEPLLAIIVAGADEGPVLERVAGPRDRDGNTTHSDRVRARKRATEVSFRAFLLPFVAGEPIPTVRAGVTPGSWRVELRGDVVDLLLEARDDGSTAVRAVAVGATPTP